MYILFIFSTYIPQRDSQTQLQQHAQSSNLKKTLFFYTQYLAFNYIVPHLVRFHSV